MSVSDADIAFALELFEGLTDDFGPLTTRKMMGGLCLYADGTIFAILHPDGTLLLKGAGAFKQVLIDDGWAPWQYLRKDGTPTNMPYWALPDALLDNPDEACAWARRALAALES